VGSPAVPDTGEIADVQWVAMDAIPQPVTNALHHALADVGEGRRGVVRAGLARIN